MVWRADLTDTYLRLDRAKEHIEAVRDKTKTFLERDPKPLDFRTEETAGPGESRKYVLYPVIRENPPPQIAAPVGDAIQNIRNALDYLVYAWSPAKHRRRGRTGFPICDDLCEFEVKGRKMIRGITGDELAFIEWHQPYKRTDPPRNDPLSVLRRLSNKDKHRLLLPVAAAVSDSASWIGSTNAVIEITHYSPGPVDDDTKILAFTARRKDPTAQMHVEAQSGLEVQLGERGLFYPDGSPVFAEISDFLDYLWHHVRHTMLAMWFEYGYRPTEESA